MRRGRAAGRRRVGGRAVGGRTFARGCRGPIGSDEFAFAPYVRSVWNAGELPGIGPAYGLAFHGRGFVRGTWDTEFEVMDVLPRALTGWQDLVVCRKRVTA